MVPLKKENIPMKIKTAIQINAPRSDVFNAFSDLNGIESVIDGIQSIEVLEGPAQMAVGTKWKETRVMFGKEATEVMWVTELDKDERYVVEAESHGTHYRSEYTFTDSKEGTDVTMTFEGKPLSLFSKIMSVMFIFFVGATKKALKQDMENLKQHLES